MKKVLDETQRLLLLAEFESVELQDKSTGERRYAGDHYGDPSCGAISLNEEYCVTGGEGVVLFNLSGEFSYAFRGFEPKDSFDFQDEAHLQWLKSFSPKGPFFVHALRFESEDQIRVLLDPWSEYASIWRLDISDKSVVRLEEGPCYRNKPWLEKVDF